MTLQHVHTVILLLGACLAGVFVSPAAANEPWIIDSTEQWQAAADEQENLRYKDGMAEPTDQAARFRSVLKTFDAKRRPMRLVLRQSPAWENWTQVDDVGPERTSNAPVFLPVGQGDYWFFAARGGGGYHAWHSTDMKTWTHHGRVAPNWTTTAEYADGRFYFYYDKPNDEDPHLVVDDDLTDGRLGENLGKVFEDPSHGSDAGVLRDSDGTFHLIYEDWSPLDASKHAWDSPLAGHADSPDGIHGFEPHEYPPPIDERTRPTGKMATYRHPTTRKDYEYEIHEPEQNAYGDYTLIKVGTQYYIFCDFDPVEGPMRVGRWTSPSLGQRFTWAGDIGGDGGRKGRGFHPDPTVGFAEGRFYLIVQTRGFDFVSPGPWVERVEARAGVDEDADGRIDRWTDWHVVREQYAHRPGFARIVDVRPAALDLRSLPAGRGFQFELKMHDTTENASKPILDRVALEFAPND